MTYAHLTDDQIRAKIAELHGWRFGKPRQYEGYCFAFNPDDDTEAITVHPYKTGEKVMWPGSGVPNWPGNIADAYQLEESVPEEGRERYAEILAGIVDDTAFFYDAEIEFDPGEGMTPREFAFALIHATPRQRSEAWLMMMEAAR